jgi:putative exporter of polyketide antibiotics
MTPRTIYLSRLLGIFLLVLAATELTQRSTLAETAMGIVNSPALLLVYGMLSLIAGLAIVLAHNEWRGGAMALVVTILGWLLLLKGAALIVIPPALWTGILQASHFAELYALYGVLPLAVGGYLTFAGFSADRGRGIRKT